VAVIRVGVLGASGRMGRHVRDGIEAAPDLELAAAVGRGDDPAVLRGVDVVVDFSSPAALAAALPALAGVALVTGTTGLDDRTRALRDAHAGTAPLLAAANFSVGITLLTDLVRRAAGALPEADVEIVEIHHRLKADAPSGTALALAAAAGPGKPLVHGREGRTGDRPAGVIGIHAVRGGDVVGEHDVHLLLDGEHLRLGHGATSRAVFAHGALRAARWLYGRPPGVYDLSAVLGLG
jgi:4-hydroxy-tetrahydrodipicolinate reductase